MSESRNSPLDQERLRTLLRDSFGLADFRAGQGEVIEALLTRGRALAVFPTGGGKSLCYQLPAVYLDGVALVVSPLIALMKDQVSYLQSRGIAAERLDSSQGVEELRRIQRLARAGSLKLLYVAPERFNNERFLALLQEIPLSLIAIDEAHCISEWGHNFRPDYLKLARTVKNVPHVLTLTATATPGVIEEICKGFEVPRDAAIVTGTYRPNLNLCITAVRPEDRDALLLQRLRQRKPGPTIVYVTLQKSAEHVAEFLQKAGLPARCYHAGLDSAERDLTQNDWMISPSGIIVATIAFGMGIDRPDVRYVYHYNLPKSLESYSQEIGRAGRDGESSVVELLACSEDIPVLENFAYGDTPSPGALHGLVSELLEQGDELDLNLYELSGKHDVRELVLRTALTYMELSGVLEARTSYFAEYEMRPLSPQEEILSDLSGSARALAEAAFQHAKRGKIWHHLDPSAAAASIGCSRSDLVEVITQLEEKGRLEVRASQSRQRYSVQKRPADPRALAAELVQRFERREVAEIARLRQLLRFIEQGGCQSAALAAYFGQTLPRVCGHCSYCRTGREAKLAPRDATSACTPYPDQADVRLLQEQHPAVLAEPRQVARFLCGLSSPAVARARLGKHPLFGTMEGIPFAEVLAWCSA